jgi:hypothetical protein
MKVRWAVLVLAACAACATTPSARHSAGSTGSAAPAHTSSSNSRVLTPTKQALALRIAQREGWSSQPSSPGTSPSGIDPSAPGSWPANVDKASVMLTTHAAALQFVGGGEETGEGSRPVLVIRLVGDFTWITTGPPGSSNATGNVATIVVDATTGQVTDTGLVRGDADAELPTASVLYIRVDNLRASACVCPGAVSIVDEQT